MVHADGRGTCAVGTGRMKVTMRGSFWLGLTDEDVGVFKRVSMWRPNPRA